MQAQEVEVGGAAAELECSMEMAAQAKSVVARGTACWPGLQGAAELKMRPAPLKLGHQGS